MVFLLLYMVQSDHSFWNLPAMLPLSWKQVRPNLLSMQAGDLQVECVPLKGLALMAGRLHISQILGVEIVDAVNLGPQILATPESQPEVVIRQDTIMVQYAATSRRPVECQARWRVLPEGIFDLEISTLTPGKWDGLAVQTCTRLNVPQADLTQVHIDDSVNPGIVIYRPSGQEISYAEFCHPHDGIALEIKHENAATSARYRLFGHDLEKGVILRGRLRGMIVPRAIDLAAVHAAYQHFLVEPPNLTL